MNYNRRKEDKMASNFEPQTAFEGYVKASLEGMEKRLDKLPCGESFRRVGKCETDIANIKGKTSVLGGVAGFIGGVLVKIFMK